MKNEKVLNVFDIYPNDSFIPRRIFSDEVVTLTDGQTIFKRKGEVIAKTSEKDSFIRIGKSKPNKEWYEYPNGDGVKNLSKDGFKVVCCVQNDEYVQIVFAKVPFNSWTFQELVNGLDKADTIDDFYEMLKTNSLPKR